MSQNAHESFGECSVCHAFHQLHNSNKSVHRVMDLATIHFLVPIRCHSQCDRMFRRPLCSSPPHHYRAKPVNRSTSRLLSISSTPGTHPAPADGFSHPQLVRRRIKHTSKWAWPACTQCVLRRLIFGTNDSGSSSDITVLILSRNCVGQQSRCTRGI